MVFAIWLTKFLCMYSSLYVGDNLSHPYGYYIYIHTCYYLLVVMCIKKLLPSCIFQQRTTQHTTCIFICFTFFFPPPPYPFIHSPTPHHFVLSAKKRSFLYIYYFAIEYPYICMYVCMCVFRIFQLACLNRHPPRGKLFFWLDGIVLELLRIFFFYFIFWCMGINNRIREILSCLDGILTLNQPFNLLRWWLARLVIWCMFCTVHTARRLGRSTQQAKRPTQLDKLWGRVLLYVATNMNQIQIRKKQIVKQSFSIIVCWQNNQSYIRNFWFFWFFCQFFWFFM